MYKSLFFIAIFIPSISLADNLISVTSGTGGKIEGLTIEQKAGLQPASPIDLPLAGAVLTEQQFYSLARKSFYQTDWDVISAANGVVTAKKHASHFFGFGTVPVNDRLQWDENAKSFVYRIEMKLTSDKIIIQYASNWGSTGEKMLLDLRKMVASNLY